MLRTSLCAQQSCPCIINAWKNEPGWVWEEVSHAVTICAAGVEESSVFCTEKYLIKSISPWPQDPLQYSKAQEISTFILIKCVSNIYMVWCSVLWWIYEYVARENRGNAQYCKAPLINQILSFKDAQIRNVFTLDLKNSFIIFKYIKKERCIAELTLQIK